jgi:hypothetical protein
MTSDRDQIRLLNDELRIHHRGGRIVITRGIQALGAEAVQRIDQAIASFDRFTKDNDPYGEHDFGSFEVNGHQFLWKIDYYNAQCLCASEDPSDPEKTTRVLTLMLAQDY